MKAIEDRLNEYKIYLKDAQSDMGSLDTVKSSKVSLDAVLARRERLASMSAYVAALSFALMEITKEEVNKKMEERNKK